MFPTETLLWSIYVGLFKPRNKIAALENWCIFRAAYMIYEFERCALNWSPLWRKWASTLWSSWYMTKVETRHSGRFSIIWDRWRLSSTSCMLREICWVEKYSKHIRNKQAKQFYLQQTLVGVKNIWQLVKTQGMMGSFIIYSSSLWLEALEK